MNYAGLVIFLISYLGIALGRIPGLAIDRTGIALLGALAMMLFNTISVSQAVSSIDYSTLILLFGLMMLSAQYDLGGFYDIISKKAAETRFSPKKFFLWIIVISAGLSAILTNDVICFALTPVIAQIAIKRKWNPIPFLLTLVAACNIGSAITIIGNPQNMFIGQAANLGFDRFMLWCGPPSVLSLIVLYFWSIRKFKFEESFITTESETYNSEKIGTTKHKIPKDKIQIYKAVVLTAIMILLFFTSIPREFIALGIAAVILMSRKFTTSRLLYLVDWPLIVLFISLFILIEGFKVSGGVTLINRFLSQSGMSLHHPFSLSLASILTSNMVSNVPAVILLMAYIPKHSDHLAYLLSLTSTYAGNLIIIGSIANLIVIQQASSMNIHISFKKHLKWITPFAIISLVIVELWWLSCSLLIKFK